MRILESLADLLLGACCPGCHAPGVGLCEQCVAAVRPAPRIICDGPPPVVACLPYRDPIPNVVPAGSTRLSAIGLPPDSAQSSPPMSRCRGSSPCPPIRLRCDAAVPIMLATWLRQQFAGVGKLPVRGLRRVESRVEEMRGNWEQPGTDRTVGGWRAWYLVAMTWWSHCSSALGTCATSWRCHTNAAPPTRTRRCGQFPGTARSSSSTTCAPPGRAWPRPAVPSPRVGTRYGQRWCWPTRRHRIGGPEPDGSVTNSCRGGGS